MKYKIYPIYLGGRDVDISTGLFRHLPGEMMRMVIGAFVLQDEAGEYTLVDTGAPSAGEIAKNGYGLRQMADSVEYIDEIKAMGIDPLKIKTIILTHLHWDHAWNLQYFPNAVIYTHRKELAYAVDPTPNQRKSYAMFPEIGGPQWIRHLLQIRAIHEEDVEILPGIRLLLTPGHTPGSMSVIVDTQKGKYVLCADLCLNMENYEQNVPTGSVNDVNAWYDSMDKLRKIAPKEQWLAHHDPAVYLEKCYG